MTLAFLVALVLGLLLVYWLASRQIRHVAPPQRGANRFCPAHHAAATKAADHTITKARFSLLEMVGAAVLVGWTVLGGLTLLNQWKELGLLGAGMAQQTGRCWWYSC